MTTDDLGALLRRKRCWTVLHFSTAVSDTAVWLLIGHLSVCPNHRLCAVAFDAVHCWRYQSAV
jgi:hypothetical protein